MYFEGVILTNEESEKLIKAFKHISFTRKKTFERNKNQFYKRYILDEGFIDNVHTKLGKEIDEAIGREYVHLRLHRCLSKNVTSLERHIIERLPIYRAYNDVPMKDMDTVVEQYPITAEYTYRGWTFPLTGYCDTIDFDNSILYERKTTKDKAIVEREAIKQLNFYRYMIHLRTGKYIKKGVVQFLYKNKDNEITGEMDEMFIDFESINKSSHEKGTDNDINRVEYELKNYINGVFFLITGRSLPYK